MNEFDAIIKTALEAERSSRTPSPSQQTVTVPVGEFADLIRAQEKLRIIETVYANTEDYNCGRMLRTILGPLPEEVSDAQ